jgi:hypothetical protein
MMSRGPSLAKVSGARQVADTKKLDNAIRFAARLSPRSADWLECVTGWARGFFATKGVP